MQFLILQILRPVLRFDLEEGAGKEETGFRPRFAFVSE